MDNQKEHKNKLPNYISYLRDKKFSIGERIKNRRKEMNITQEKFSELLFVYVPKKNKKGENIYVKRQTISNWENGRTVPNIEYLLAMCEKLVLDCDLGYLLCQYDTPHIEQMEAMKLTGLSADAIYVLEQQKRALDVNPDDKTTKSELETVSKLLEYSFKLEAGVFLLKLAEFLSNDFKCMSEAEKKQQDYLSYELWYALKKFIDFTKENTNKQ